MMTMSTVEERRAARQAALDRHPELRQQIAPRKPIQHVAGGKPGPLFSRRVTRKRPRLGPRIDND
jgi:hypothetical protein